MLVKTQVKNLFSQVNLSSEYSVEHEPEEKKPTSLTMYETTKYSVF